ncbi:MAG TPA: TIR domain-containing protein [Hyphomonadaceae bacterium]|nr:TIR domain-containing protein [Hyphomonadaceae bacterium]
MTDVYISYAREDRERIRPLAEMLQFEGWDVWWDPSEPTIDGSAAIDFKLGSAGAILVVWSAYSRASEYVRSEAATGLYKNKLIQARIDSAAPPRPFDQVEVIDVNHWSGERDDPHWRRILAAVRLYAGEPGSTRPQVMRRSPTGLGGGAPAYLEPGKSIAWAPIIAAAFLAVAAGGLWFADPFKWRSGGGAPVPTEAVATTESAANVPVAAIDPVSTASMEDTAESDKAWASVKRDQPEALRAFVAAYPKATGAETARSLLRVLDAQSWVEAVTSDNEAGYNSYLKQFPADAAISGAMASSARERLVSLTAERTQAIEDIQRGLTALNFYKGKIDGKGGDGTYAAAKQFAASRKRFAPVLSSAAPRDLRAFADVIRNALPADATVSAAAKPAPAPTAAAPPAPIVATATTKPAATPTPANTAAAADRQRIAQAQAAANQAAAAQAALEKQKTDAAKLADAQKTADANAWSDAEKAGTVASYQSYLASYPAGAQVAAARAAIIKLNRPPAYSLDQLPAEVKVAAEAARRAQTTATSRASAAREAADSATNAPGRSSITAANGDRYDSQISNGAPNGLGVRVSGKAASAGDRYRGELRNGQSVGLGVYDFGDNPNNAQAGALRYEGEHVGDAASGYGVTYWKNGDTFSGQEAANGSARGVLSFTNGQRYEGEVRNGARNGFGVVWSADGQMLMAGRWENGQLVENSKQPAASSNAIVQSSLAPAGGGSNP